MPTSTLADIRAKVRKLTGRNSTTQLTDAEIDQYVNTYYAYDLPDYLKLNKLKDVYTFTTIPNIDTYPFPSNSYLYCEPPATCAGVRIDFYTSNEQFYTRWPKINYQQQIGSGNGTPGPYVGTLTNTPLLRSVNATTTQSNVTNILFTGASAGGSSVATDDGAGGFLAPAAGSIDYITGAYSVTFPAAIDAGEPIWAEYIPYVASRPFSMMFFQNQIVLRPVPDISYIVEINALRNATDLIAAGNNPELNEWWQLLAFGAANKILIDNADFEIIANIRPYFEEQLILCQRRVIAQGRSQRASTLFSENQNFPYGNNYPYI